MKVVPRGLPDGDGAWRLGGIKIEKHLSFHLTIVKNGQILKFKLNYFSRRKE
jgi:hypothetical protein